MYKSAFVMAKGIVVHLGKQVPTVADHKNDSIAKDQWNTP